MAEHDLLGAVALYMVPADEEDDTRVTAVTRIQLGRWWRSAGLQERFLPPIEGSGASAFKSAASERLNTSYEVEGVTYRLEVGPLEASKKDLVRQVYVRWEDEEGPHEQRAVELRLFREKISRQATVRHGTERLRLVHHKGFTGEHLRQARLLVAQCRKVFKAFIGNMTPHALRYSMRVYLTVGFQAVPLPTDSAYFVPREKAEDPELFALAEVLVKCGAQLTVMPVVDLPRLRRDVCGWMDVFVTRKTNTLTRAIDDWVAKNVLAAPSMVQLGVWRQEYRTWADALVQYADSYPDQSFPLSAQALELAHKLIEELENR